MKNRIKRIVELAYGINSTRSEWFVDVSIKGYFMPSNVHIFNVMSKTSEDYDGEIYGDSLCHQLNCAERRLEEIWERVQDNPLPKIIREAHRPRKDLDEEKIVELYKTGMTVEKIAKEMGCSAYPIRRILLPIYGDEWDRLPAHRAGQQTGRPKLDRGKIMALHNAGWNNVKIADEMSCKPETIRDILRELRKTPHSMQ